MMSVSADTCHGQTHDEFGFQAAQTLHMQVSKTKSVFASQWLQRTSVPRALSRNLPAHLALKQ